MHNLLRTFITVILLGVFAASAVAQTTGRIDGTVTDATTGEPLPGVNVVLAGTQQGAVSNADGYYTIVGVRAGTYSLQASFIGYTEQTIEDVRVNVGLTTTIDFTLSDAAIGLDEVFVTAERPIIQRDVSASVANITAEEIQNLPITDVERVVGLQAGFERGLTVRGSGGDQVAFQVDGMSLNSGRDNVPFTGISYTAVEEVQVQTGGFNAEYGNVRSGLINVIAKEGSRDRYTADFIVRYSPPSYKNFHGYTDQGERVQDPNSDLAYWKRPLFDPHSNVPFEGVGAWDPWTRRQYRSFDGWNARANAWNSGRDESEHVTPQQMQEAMRWFYRKDFSPNNPDYEVDGTIGGPIPALGQLLGDLRFTASYRQTQSEYIFPFTRDTYQDRTFQGKLTSDVAMGMKLSLHGLYATQNGMNLNGEGWPNMFTGDLPYYPWDQTTRVNLVGFGSNDNDGGGDLYSGFFVNFMDVDRFLLGGQLTHAISPNTFYDVQIERMSTDYNTYPDRQRVYDDVVCYVQTADGGVQQLDAHPEQGCGHPDIQAHPGGVIALDEAIFGYENDDMSDPFGASYRTAGHWGNGRDTSSVVRWRAKFDITSQVNRYMQIKSGAEYIYNDLDTRYGRVDPAHPHHANPTFVWRRQPNQGAIYGQTKLEFQGMVANVGLRADYFHAGGDWYEFPEFTRVLASQWGRESLDDPEALQRDDWGTAPTDHQITVSPRLGVSYPITDDSKLYFNYGHFRQSLDPISMFTIQEINTGAVTRIGDPNHPMPRTVSYELGYEHNIADQFLLRLAGYYRDLHFQPRQVWFQSIDGEVNYNTSRPWNYRDVRGLEVTLMKNRGDWIRGFVNYTYMATKTGNFGFSNVYQNPVQQREFLRTSTDHYQSRPIPEPFARFNVEFLVPQNFGPEIGGSHLLGDWRINLLGEWRMGQSLSYAGGTGYGDGGNPALRGNLRYRDYYNVDMRLSKNFGTAIGAAQFFVDINNVFNFRHMHRFGAFQGPNDLTHYLQSLHFPEDTFEGREGGDPYQFIAGNDRPGTFRKPGVEFVPIQVGSLPDPSDAHTRPLYYVPSEETYYQLVNGSFQQADQGFVDQVLSDRAYIDMPNEVYRTFLNPRNVFFGLRLSF